MSSAMSESLQAQGDLSAPIRSRHMHCSCSSSLCPAPRNRNKCIVRETQYSYDSRPCLHSNGPHHKLSKRGPSRARLWVHMSVYVGDTAKAWARSAPESLLARPLVDALGAGVISPDHCWVQVEFLPVCVGQPADKSSLIGIIPAPYTSSPPFSPVFNSPAMSSWLAHASYGDKRSFTQGHATCKDGGWHVHASDKERLHTHLTAFRSCLCILATSRTRPAPSSMKDSAVGDEGFATTSGLPPATGLAHH